MSLYTFLRSIPIIKKPVYNLVYNRLAKKQLRENQDVIKRLEHFKDIHKGDSCFIIGTGPSLKTEDLKKIAEREITTFAPNRIFELCSKIDWSPSYYICQDHNIIKTFSDDIKTIPSIKSFLPVEYKKEFKGDKYNFFVLREKEYYPGDPRFGTDLTKYLEQGYTVTYGAIQLAIYMGFKTIYLLGIDHNYSVFRDAKGRPVRKNSQKKDYPEGMTQYMTQATFPRIEESTLAYDKAEKESKRLGVKIYNATRGGKLEAFERVNFDQLINNWNK